jgi:hypothetical protein
MLKMNVVVANAANPNGAGSAVGRTALAAVASVSSRGT